MILRRSPRKYFLLNDGKAPNEDCELEQRLKNRRIAAHHEIGRGLCLHDIGPSKIVTGEKERQASD